jgi:hypothetical protein
MILRIQGEVVHYVEAQDTQDLNAYTESAIVKSDHVSIG